MRVVGIHGIAQTFEGAATLEAEWLPALQSGLEEAGYPRLSDSDFCGIGYGALFRPECMKSGSIPRLTAHDVKEGEEEELLLLWWKEAARLADITRTTNHTWGEDPRIQGPDFEGKGRTPELVQRALRQLAKSRFFSKLGSERVLIFALQQVRLFLLDPRLKQAVLERVAKKMSTDTQVVIGHSLGAVVAYEALCAHPEWNVHTLVTLGAPLGIRELIFDKLTPRPQDGVGVWPNVQHWVNIADQGDIVALEKKLAPLFGPVQDQIVYNGSKSHNIRHYLTAQETGEAVGAGLSASS